MDFSHRAGFRFWMIVGFIFLAACQAAPTPAPTTAPMSSPMLSPGPSHTPIPNPSSTPQPSSSPTQRSSPTLAASATSTITYIAPTKRTPCENDINCLVSPDGQWAVEEFCEMRCMNSSRPSALPYIRIYKKDGSTAWTIYCDQRFPVFSNESKEQLRYVPWMFDPSGRWLYARIGVDVIGDGPFAPRSYGLVRIDLLTGKVVPLLKPGEYFEMGFSPDSSSIVYTMKYTLGILDLNTGDQQFISLPYVFASYLEWSPDGSQFMLVALNDLSDFLQPKMDVVVVSPGSDQPLKVIYTIPPGKVMEWNPVYGIVVQTYDRVLENGRYVDKYGWWGIDPQNPTPVPIPSPTPRP